MTDCSLILVNKCRRLLIIGLAFACFVAAQDRPRRRPGDDPRGPQNTEYRTAVPAHPWDAVLGRPTRHSVVVNVLTYEDYEGFIEYGAQPGAATGKTPVRQFKQGEPQEVLLASLRPDTQYFYRLKLRRSASEPFAAGPEYSFHTQRGPQSGFVFTLQADSHLDQNTNPAVYARTLANARAAQPDFHIELGDTFMTDKYPRYQDALQQYLAQRYYFGLLCHSAPLFFTLGNHDGEAGRWLNGTPDNMAVWANATRRRYFSNPVPDGFYTGNQRPDPQAGMLQDYYAFEWGNALFVVLDPFWYTRQRGNDDNWTRTLGAEQYEWLRQTLAGSRAKFKFIFIHHLVGGSDRNARGGAEAARYYEWGGRNADGSNGFPDRRPGWAAPLHQLLVQNKVAAVFHGHDHFFAKQDLDGIVYQEVPQPGYQGADDPRNAGEYGYLAGDFQGGAGHLRVTVNRDNVKVEYIRSYLPGAEASGRKNGAASYTYQITVGK